MDALSEILHSVKLDGAVFYNVKLTSPWGVRSPSSRELATFLKQDSKHVIMYHFLSQGHARCEVEHSNFGADLLPGDVVVFPHGDAHVLSNGCPASIMDNSKQLKKVFAQGMELAHYGGGGDATLLVCGYMQCDREFSKMFLGGRFSR